MLAEERFGQILNLLSKQRTATVQELCEALDTSESTIRSFLLSVHGVVTGRNIHGKEVILSFNISAFVRV